MSDDIVERLRAFRTDGAYIDRFVLGSLLAEAAAELDRLCAPDQGGARVEVDDLGAIFADDKDVGSVWTVEDRDVLRAALRGEPRPSDEDLLGLVRDLTDSDPCSFDHHGYCQAHFWLTDEPSCPHGRAKAVLDAGGDS